MGSLWVEVFQPKNKVRSEPEFFNSTKNNPYLVFFKKTIEHTGNEYGMPIMPRFHSQFSGVNNTIQGKEQMPIIAKNEVVRIKGSTMKQTRSCMVFQLVPFI